ncbi:Hypothetical predicted protein [Pelobates cultripes]|uniref:PXA domain-containing protein n=1 Tax=Pelobates cultripes TaxID=61616 RepID=A0AAD1T1J1_PELCU|nr:Hypothetical predicted protein [Pelobates cultripes]
MSGRWWCKAISVCVWVKSYIYHVYITVAKTIYPYCKPNSPEMEVLGEREGNSLEEPEDVVDTPNNSEVWDALKNVSKAIYQTYVDLWLKAPGKIENHPLYKQVNNGILDIYNNAKQKMCRIESSKLILIVANGLTKHLRRFRKNKITNQGKTREEEVNFLREKTKLLLNHLLPNSMKDSVHLLAMFTEIIAISVLETTINYLADPAFINLSIVNCCSNTTNGIQVRSDQAAGKSENDSPLSSSDHSLEIDSGEHSPQTASSSDSEHSLCSLSCLKWKDEKWHAIIFELRNNKFRILVIKEDGGQEVWHTERSIDDFYTLIENCPELDKTLIPSTAQNPSAGTDTQKSENIEKVQLCVALLVSNIKENEDAEAAFFLSPFNYNQKERELFESNLSEEELLDESSSGTLSIHSDGSSESDGISYRGLKVSKWFKKGKKGKQSTATTGSEESPETGLNITHNHSQEELNNVSESHLPYMSFDVVGGSDVNSRAQKKLEKQRKKTKEQLQNEAKKALFDLINEICTGDNPLLNFVNVLGCLDGYINMIFRDIQRMFSEDKIPDYLNSISDLILSTEEPSMSEEEALKKASELIQQLLKEFLSNRTGLKVITKVLALKKYIKETHEAFQNSIANKETLFNLLEDVSKVITEEDQ